MRHEPVRRAATWAGLALVVWWAWRGLGFDAGALSRTPLATGRFLDRLWPPDWSILPAVGDAFIETLQIALLATVIGYILALPLALVAARNLAPAWVAVPARTLASGIRVLPSLLWAILAVIVFGPGPFAGVVAMALYTAGYLAKLQYEAFEGLERGILDALRATGATRFQVAWHGVLPAAQNILRSQLLFMLEYNVRASTVIGVVGAGGVGMLLNLYLQALQYARVTTVVLVLFVAVVAIDAASAAVRRRFMDVDAPRARWRDLFRAPAE